MRADRLLSMMFLLHARGRMTARDLADELEISERTVYRDVEALSYAGVPVYTQTGTNGGVFLDETYRVTLNGLNKGELEALFVAGGGTPLADLGITSEGTLLKLLASLPSMQKQAVQNARQRLYIDSQSWFAHPESLPHLQEIYQAVWDDQRIELTYRAYGDEITTRLIDPYGLINKANIWYVLGRRSTGEMRVYRVSRVIKLCQTGETFTRPLGFDLGQTWLNLTRSFERNVYSQNPPYTARFSIDKPGLEMIEARWIGLYEVLERPTDTAMGEIKASFESFQDALGFLLSMGTMIRVLDPPELVTSIRQIAQSISLLYPEPESLP